MSISAVMQPMLRFDFVNTKIFLNTKFALEVSVYLFLIREEPVLDEELPDLLPCLRPYQRRAAYWMVQREKGATTLGEKVAVQLSAPYSVPISFVDESPKMFYNPFK